MVGAVVRASDRDIPAVGARRDVRLHWIDWLRVAAIAGVVVFHTLRPFDATEWHVKNAETSGLIGASQVFFSTFGLAVLFLLAGAGARFALEKRAWRTFLRERVARLLVPFVVGTFLLSPVQASIEAADRGTATSAWPDFLRWWLDAPGAIASHGLSPSVFGLGYHLWFLGFLFVISAAGLPACAALRSPRGQTAVAWLAGRISARRGTTLAVAVPIAASLLAFAPLGTGEHDWAEFGQYLAYFLVGFVLLSDVRFLAAVRRDLWPAVAAALLSTAGLIALDFFEWLTNEASRGFDPRSLAVAVLFVLEGWASTLIVLNVGLRAGRLQRPVGRRLGDAVLPVYVIHQPVILAAAFVVVRWPLGIAPKWLLVFGISTAVTLALVDLALRSPTTRMLLGVRVRPAARSVEVPASVRTRAPAGPSPAAIPDAGPR